MTDSLKKNERRSSERQVLQAPSVAASTNACCSSQQIDWRLIPLLSLLYLMAYLDRANIGNAKIEGMLDTLGMSEPQYNIALSIFFVTYIMFGMLLPFSQCGMLGNNTPARGSE